MNGKYLLDTNILIKLFAGDENVIKWLKKAPEIFIPSIVLGELYYGAQKSSNKKNNLTKIDELSTSSNIIPCDSGTARHYGLIKNQLKEKGKPIPENDIWIGAIALQHRLTLVTKDVHFKEIKGMVLIDLDN